MKIFALLFLLVNTFFFSNISFAEEESVEFEEIIENNNTNNYDIVKEGDEKNISKIIEKVLISTVTIEAIKLDDVKIRKKKSHFVLEKFGSVSEIGTGFLISEDGYVITNNHVVEGANKVVIRMSNGKRYNAEVIGDDYYLDISLLKINNNNSEKFKFLDLNPDVEVNLGEGVVAIGNPYGLGLSISRGIVSAVHRDIKDTGYSDMIQTDVNINRGNSGGPLFNINGDIIGINSAIFSADGDKNIGVSFAIPIKNIMASIDKLREFGYIQRGWIGIKGVDANEDIFRILNSKRETGILVKDVIEGSPADKAGIQPADIIISYNNKHIKNFNDLLSMIRNSSVNSSVSVLILRNGKYMKLRVNVKELPNNEYQDTNEKIAENSMAIMDMILTQVDRSTINKYKLYNGYENKAMYVLDVENGGLAEKIGIEKGDLILSINQVQLKNKAILNSLINGIESTKQKEVIIVIRKAKNFENVVIKTRIRK